jgi:hypothetical protein
MLRWKLTSARVIKVYLEVCLVVGALGGGVVLALLLLVSPGYVQRQGADVTVTVGLGSRAIHPLLPLAVGDGAPGTEPAFLRAGLVDGSGELRAVTTIWRLYFLSMAKLVVAIAVLLWIFWVLRSFLRTVLDGEPFHPANGRRLRAVGLVLIGLTLVAPGVEYLLGRAVLARLTVEGPALTPVLCFPGEAFLAGLIFLVFSSVFRHGTELEEERSLTV